MKLISKEDGTFCNIGFKKDQVIEVNELLGDMLLKKSEGKIVMYSDKPKNIVETKLEKIVVKESKKVESKPSFVKTIINKVKSKKK